MVGDPHEDLLERFVQGDQDALEVLFERFAAEVHGWILRIVRDSGAAEEVLVECFWRAYRGRARFDASRSFGAWMRRIATNASLDHLRAARRHARWSGVDHDAAAPASPNPDLRESVAIAFRRLPPKLQAVAALALIEEKPLAEIAEALALPLGTVKSRVSRASARLRKELASLGIRP
jgi:RNA polymerase sigma factor (sigma-70 family)